MANATCDEPVVVLNAERSREVRAMAKTLGESAEALTDRAVLAFLQQRSAEYHDLSMFELRR